MATLPWINPLHLNNISLMVAGFSTMMCVLFCKDYGTLVIFASIYGLTIGKEHTRVLCKAINATQSG